MKAETGVSRTFLKEEDLTKLVNIQQLIDRPIATLPNSINIKATHKGLLTLHEILLNRAKEALVYPRITNESLLYIDQICDDKYLS